MKDRKTNRRLTHPTLRIFVRSVAGVCVVCVAVLLAFLQHYHFYQLKQAAVNLLYADTNLHYIQTPTVILSGPNTVQISWTWNQHTDTAYIEYAVLNKTNGQTLASYLAATKAARVGPLGVWYRHTASISVDDSQCIKYSVKADIPSFNMGSPQKYCHKLSLQKSTDAGSFFAMGIVDFVELYRDRSLKWTRMIREQLISEELDIVIDISSETDVTGSNQLGQIAQAPSKNAFSGWISDTCMIFASSLDPLTWKNASICEEGSKTILVLTIDWKDLLLYKLGSSGWYEGPVYTRYLDALLQHNVKAAVLKTGHRFYLVEVWDRRYCDGVFCKPETAVPVCGYMAQFLRLCPPVSGASLFSGFGRVMRLDAYGISKDMFEDNGEAELPIVERVEL